MSNNYPPGFDESLLDGDEPFASLEEAESYYWEKVAKNNEDEAGLERWLETVEILSEEDDFSGATEGDR
jgi:hypothetical protein